MENVFDTLIDSYLLNNVGICENFLDIHLAENLKINLNKLFDEEKLSFAKIGKGNSPLLDNTIRSDKIFWLDRSHENSSENSFFDLMDNFVSFLNSTCYTGITSYEFHYALYEKGSFYSKHLDQFQANTSRQYTMIFYLNPDWKLADGGELCVYHKNSTQNISPTNGKCVFFKSSELEHEVLLSHNSRLSITGWFKVD